MEITNSVQYITVQDVLMGEASCVIFFIKGTVRLDLTFLRVVPLDMPRIYEPLFILEFVIVVLNSSKESKALNLSNCQLLEDTVGGVEFFPPVGCLVQFY
jgi:hypothetical protein